MFDIQNKLVGDVKTFIQGQDEAVTRLLCGLMRFPSTTGNEGEIQLFLERELKEMGLETSLVLIPGKLTDDEEYSFPERVMSYEGRPNCVAYRRGRGSGGRSLILNTHVDVVPPEKTWVDAFNPRVEAGVIYGRGACDAKGQIVTIVTALKALNALGLTLKGDVMAQFVIEEEPGGNGSLALLRQGFWADGAIVVEATGMRVHPANRGAIWFRISVDGKSVHMSRVKEGVSAVKEMMRVIQILEDYERRLIEDSRGQPLFEGYDAVQVNVGMMHGGEWPSMVPAKAVIEGGVGFLPNKMMSDIKRELEAAILTHGDEWLKQHFKLEFPKLHNASYAIPVNHPLVTTLAQSCEDVGLPMKVTGWISSCDARLFWHVGKIPVVVFGPGNIGYAHSTLEQIKVEDILKSAEALTTFIIQWCGLAD